MTFLLHFSFSPYGNLFCQHLLLNVTFFYLLEGFATSSSTRLRSSSSFSSSLHISSLGVFVALAFLAERATLFVLLRNSSHSLNFVFFFYCAKALMSCALTMIFMPHPDPIHSMHWIEMQPLRHPSRDSSYRNPKECLVSKIQEKWRLDECKFYW